MQLVVRQCSEKHGVDKVTRHRLRFGVTTIGKARKASNETWPHIRVVALPRASRYHAELHVTEAGVWLQDTSTNGIFCEGERLSAACTRMPVGQTYDLLLPRDFSADSIQISIEESTDEALKTTPFYDSDTHETLQEFRTELDETRAHLLELLELARDEHQGRILLLERNDANQDTHLKRLRLALGGVVCSVVASTLLRGGGDVLGSKEGFRPYEARAAIVNVVEKAASIFELTEAIAAIAVGALYLAGGKKDSNVSTIGARAAVAAQLARQVSVTDEKTIASSSPLSHIPGGTNPMLKKTQISTHSGFRANLAENQRQRWQDR